MKLSRTMSLEDFENGYFYAAELKFFAKDIGIRVANLRKFELEGLIAAFLKTGQVPVSHPSMPRKSATERDVLAAETQVVNYVGDKRTKTFLLSLIEAQTPGLKNVSGQWYWLNDWRRQKQSTGAQFTYQMLSSRLQDLMQTEGRLPQIPSARMNNFITDFKGDPANEAFTRDAILLAWHRLKEHRGPKTYAEFLNAGLNEVE